MSNGGKVENKRERENTVDKRVDSRDFGSAISRIAVAQICESVGFESCNESALDSFADIAIKYLFDLGKTATSYANLAGRSECNVFDIVGALEDLYTHTGFLGAAEVNGCGMNSGVMREIVEYVESAEEIPFAQPVPHFPVVKVPRMIPSFEEMGETPEFKHIPPWLPAFPDPHTYIHTPTWNERESDPRADKIELVRQRRKAERSLLNLQQRLVCNGLPVASSSEEPNDTENGLGHNEIKNPFLAKTLQAGEKDVSPIALPVKFSAKVHTNDHASLLETFAPAIEAMKDGLSETGNGMEKIVPDKRPAVCLEFRPGKKVLGDSLNLRLWNKSSSRTATWFRRDEDKDDKKRRAELILRQSVENQQELTQL
ncbi:PREDICTED: transcription initiation factor TFIID subunit 8 isoform X2 [Ipomoea nil]|nr:PREDICTED: transcription initiation factor TFIID subunit 8 isoform X2 [Ipomoea nil]